MIELYSGTATLCSVAKQFGMQGSLALDKMRKRARDLQFLCLTSSILRIGLCLYHWLKSPLLVWLHMRRLWNLLQGATDPQWWTSCSQIRSISNGFANFECCRKAPCRFGELNVLGKLAAFQLLRFFRNPGDA